MNPNLHRPAFARITGTAAVAGLAGCSGILDDDDGAGPAGEDSVEDQDDDAANESEGDDDGDVFTDVVPDGQSNYWLGIAPDEIEGGENPTLEFEEGVEYSITIESGDGVQHNLVFWDDESEIVDDYQTVMVVEEGASETLEFTATEEMIEYRCSVHEEEMVGDIDIVGTDGENDDSGDTSNGETSDDDDGQGDVEQDDESSGNGNED